MRNVYEIINELQAHPDCLTIDVYTIGDVIDYMNETICEEHEGIKISKEDLSPNDFLQIQKIMSSNITSMYSHTWDQSPYPHLSEIDDLSKKIDRQIKINKLLENN